MLIFIDQALVHQLMLNDQPQPSLFDYAITQNWLKHAHGGASDLRGPGGQTWLPAEYGGRPLPDLLAVAPRNGRQDKLSRLANRLLAKTIGILPSRMVKVSPQQQLRA